MDAHIKLKSSISLRNDRIERETVPEIEQQNVVIERWDYSEVVVSKHYSPDQGDLFNKGWVVLYW